MLQGRAESPEKIRSNLSDRDAHPSLPDKDFRSSISQKFWAYDQKIQGSFFFLILF